MDYESKIKSLNLVLPDPPKPVGSYHPVVLCGGFAFLSGQVSRNAKGEILGGKLGRDLNLDQGKQAAQIAALNAISLIRAFVGFEKLERLVRVVGYVQADPGFYEIPQVVNGASDLFLAVFGDAGIHARSAVGMVSLPMNAAVEIEVTLKLKS